MSFRKLALFVLGLGLFFCPASSWAQSGGNIEGVLKDPTGAALPGATVEISNPVSGYRRETVTGLGGDFRFTNLPFNPYHLVVNAKGFSPHTVDVDVRSTVPVTLGIDLKLGSTSENITVEATGADLVETESTPHTDVDREIFDKLPLESASSSLSSLVTLASPGVVADSNGLFHGLGDHAENSFSVDGQPITDQQSKVFSNQIPVDAIQSMEVISGAPPAEYGDKTSLVVKVTTRSGLGQTKPTGNITTSYGSFGSVTAGGNFAIGGSKWGNFISLNGLNSGRFLDPPEFSVMHAKGNEENAFDRLDFQPNTADTLHFNFGYTRSWFQTPNSFDAQFHPCSNPLIETCDAGGTVVVNPVTLTPLGPSDQRSQIKTFNIAPTWNHVIGTTAVFTLGGFVRRDHYNYYPSGDPFADFSTNLQSTSSGQDRTLTNAGAHADVSYVKGAHNVKVGVTYQHTFLTENDTLGIVDPSFLGIGSCPNASNPACPFDLTQGGSLFHFHGHTDIKELALFVQDTITKGSWSFSLGIRGDIYRGISSASQAEPRAGIAYNIKPTNTVLRVSYARVLETPFNENLVVASVGDPLGVFASVAGTPAPIPPGQRNDFHAGFEQAIGKHFVIDADYMWKYTHNAYDFSVLFNTPITFPIAWKNSKIYGPSVRVSIPNYHGFTAFFTASSAASRFFNPQVGGLGTDVNGPTGVFRIDHDQKFQQTTHIQYQPRATWPWIGFNWRYDNGLVAGGVPCFNLSGDPENSCGQSVVIAGVNAVDLNGISADQQFQAGLFCGSSHPTPTTPITSSLSSQSTDGPSVCPASLYGSTLIKIPAPGTENDDHNPKRIAPRNLFDLSLGDDNLFHGDKYKWSARVTVINVANKVALYNFLSTFSGTHYVTPRAITGEIGFHF
ncbi:MAG: Oar protein [Candidatus Acidoferrum typicum]|nr:Oar protein [Candidatus Acidoferrum typicum]